VYQLIPRDDTRIVAVLQMLCTRLNQTRDEASLEQLRLGLQGALEPRIQLRIAELNEELIGLPQVATRAEALLSGAPLTFALSAVQVQTTGDRARVDCDLLVTVSGSGEQRRDLRPTRILLRQAKGAWLIERIEVDRVAPSEPEPRP
jgi:hypothetical protein